MGAAASRCTSRTSRSERHRFGLAGCRSNKAYLCWPGMGPGARGWIRLTGKCAVRDRLHAVLLLMVSFTMQAWRLCPMQGWPVAGLIRHRDRTHTVSPRAQHHNVGLSICRSKFQSTCIPFSLMRCSAHACAWRVVCVAIRHPSSYWLHERRIMPVSYGCHFAHGHPRSAIANSVACSPSAIMGCARALMTTPTG